MHIKWKLKKCRIQLWHKKMKFVTIFGEKIKFLKFSPLCWQDFFFEIQNFQNFFYTTPKFIPYTNFKHQKWKLHVGFIIIPLPYWTGRASKQAASWFLPPLVFLGLINKVEILKISLSSLNIFHSVWLVLENLSVFKFVIWESSSPVLNFLACELVKIGSNLSKLVQTCQYWLTFV